MTGYLTRLVLGTAFSTIFGHATLADLTWDRTEITAPMLPHQEELVVRFHFKNSGSDSISIKSMTSLCSCTTIKLAKKLYAAGESGEIIVNYVPGSRMGTQRNVLTIQTDSAKDEKDVLTLTAEIPVIMRLERPFLLWKESESPVSKTLAIHTMLEHPIESITIKSANAKLDVKVERVDAQNYLLRVTPQGGQVSATVLLEASLAGNHKKRASAFIRVR